MATAAGGSSGKETEIEERKTNGKSSMQYRTERETEMEERKTNGSDSSIGRQAEMEEERKTTPSLAESGEHAY